jgi:GNAT superfamily N-acetyltransferase
VPAAVFAVLDGDVAVRIAEALGDVYADAFAAPPHNEPPEAAGRFRESLARHAALPGFRAAVAWAAGAEPAGFGYGHTSLPGQWWHDRAAAALPSERVARWLHEPFVVVELAVRPRLQRRGIGGSLQTSCSRGCRMPPRCWRPARTTRGRDGCTMPVAGRRSGAIWRSSPAAIRT